MIIGSGVLLKSITPTNVYYLLGKGSKSKKWSSFGGKVKKMEEPLECARRELAEETFGLVKCKKSHHGYIDFDIYRGKYRCYFFNIFYDPNIPFKFKTKVYMKKYSEINEIRWFTLSELHTLLIKKSNEFDPLFIEDCKRLGL